MLGNNRVAAGGRTELQYSIGGAVQAGMKVKIAVSGMQLMDLDAESSYKFHFDNVKPSFKSCGAADALLSSAPMDLLRIAIESRVSGIATL